jgi:hypothetical protein
MTYNPKLFLQDYPGAVTGSTVSATDIAIASLNSGARLAALRNADSRRRQSQSTIFQQNANSRVIPNLMPLATGANTVASSRDYSFYFGSTAYGAVKTIHRFDLTSKQISSLGAQLTSTIGTATAAVSSVSNAFVFNPQTINKLNFSSLSCSQVSSGLSSYANLLATPIAIGGTDVFAVLNIATNLSVYTFSTGVNTTTGTSLNANNIFYSSAIQSITNGYSFGGWNPSNVIQKVVLSTRVISTLGASLNNTTGAAAGICNTTVGYSVGGYTSGAATSVISKLTFSGETTSAVSASLTTALLFRHGSGSATSGVLAGGSPNTGGSLGTNIVDEFTYSGEAIARLSATLTEGVGLVASSSTYSPGFP